PEAATRAEPLLEFAPEWRTIDLAQERIQRVGLVYGLLARWDCFPALTGLNLNGNLLTRQSIEEFADSPLLGQLTSLGLSANGFGPDGWVEVLRSKYCKRLTELELGHNGLSAEQVLLFGDLPAAERLARLDLSFNHLGATGAVDLTETAQALPGLRELTLSGTELADDGVRALVSGPLLSQLHTLDLSLNRIGDAGARALLAYPYPTQFHRLDLIYNAISPSMGKELSRRFGKRVCLFHR